ncbi:MAG: NYN domain-containing protein [Gemmatimonadetes bacterium]|nr:NYN domain-containing protein [Gemmatimonadota bacterium]
MNQEYARAPHRPASETPQHTAALLIDFDNVTMGIRSNLGQELRNFLESDIIRGKVAVQRAYADWRRYPQYIVPLSEASIDLIFAPAYGSSKKNATDIRLAIDALELVFTRPEIATFILLSGDSDLSRLVLKLKEYGKYVIGVGLQESTSDILVQNCDEYYSYTRLSGLTSAEEIQTERHDPWELVQKAIARMVERGDVMRSDRLKQVMLEMDPGFDEKTTGYSKFNRFLGEAAQRELIRLHKRENGQYDVAPLKSDAASAVGGAEPSTDRSSSRSRSRRGRRGGRGRGPGAAEPTDTTREPRPSTAGASGDLSSAFDALAGVVRELAQGSKPVRDSMAKRKLLAQDASFDERTLGFSKFSLFLRRADEEGVIEMKQGEDGNYYLTPASGRKKGSTDRPTRSMERPTRSTPVDAEKEVVGLDKKEGVLARTLGLFRRGSDEATPDAKTRPETRSTPTEDRAPGTETPDRSDRGGRGRSQQGQGRAPRGRSDGAPRTEATSKAKPRTESKAGAEDERRTERASGSRSGRSPRTDQKRSEDRSRERSGGRDQGRGGRQQGRGRRSDSSDADRRGARAESKADARPARDKRGDRGGGSKRQRSASEPEPKKDEPRRLGRYRSGSLGRATPSAPTDTTRSRIGPIPDDELPSRGSDGGDAKPAVEADEERTASAPGPDASGFERTAVATRSTRGSDADGPVSHMVRNYAGVGKRTAEALFDHFGAEVFDVIDREPKRLREVLSEGRAKVVVEARKNELAS